MNSLENATTRQTGKIECFVIMPFGKTGEKHTEEYWTNHYQSLLKPLIEEIDNVKVHRSEALRGNILNQIINDLIFSNIVVADLTDCNPNVYWELGVRQSFKHCTITIVDDSTELPFDLTTKGTLRYHPEDPTKMNDFKVIFKKAVEDCITNPQYPDSHVLETISGRGTIYEIISKEETNRKLKALLFELTVNKSLMDQLIVKIKRNARQVKTTDLGLAYIKTQIDCLTLLNTTRYLTLRENEWKMIIELLVASHRNIRSGTLFLTSGITNINDQQCKNMENYIDRINQLTEIVRHYLEKTSSPP